MKVGRTQHVTVSREAMACTFCLVFPAGQRDAVELGCAALDEVERLEEKLSVFRPDSDISRINREAFERPVTVDAEVFEVLATAARISAETGGAFDIASGALSRVWGFYRGPKRVPPEAELAEALAASGMRHVVLEPAARTVRFLRRGVELNLGAIGKGYAIDRALCGAGSQPAAGARLASVLMHGGCSSIRAVGPGWKVAIGDPFRPGRAIGAVRLLNRAMGTSGSAHQFFVAGGRRYGHILDPRTGRPANAVAGATVLAPTAAEADALSTAFYVLGVEAARAYVRSHPGVAAILVKPPQIIALGAEIEFFAPDNPLPAGARRQPMPGPPAGSFEVTHA